MKLGYCTRYGEIIHIIDCQLQGEKNGEVETGYRDSRFDPHSCNGRCSSFSCSASLSLGTETMSLPSGHPSSKARTRAQSSGRRRTSRVRSSARRSATSSSGSQRRALVAGRRVGRSSGTGVCGMGSMVDLTGVTSRDGKAAGLKTGRRRTSCYGDRT
jgi:hypothetical protein